MKLWIAKDLSEELILYKERPSYNDKLKMWVLGGLPVGKLRGCFPEVTFENSPQQVEIKLVSEIISVEESPSKTFPRVNEFEVGASYRR